MMRIYVLDEKPRDHPQSQDWWFIVSLVLCCVHVSIVLTFTSEHVLADLFSEYTLPAEHVLYQMNGNPYTKEMHIHKEHEFFEWIFLLMFFIEGIVLWPYYQRAARRWCKQPKHTVNYRRNCIGER